MALTSLSVHDLAAALLGCVCHALERTALEVVGQPGCPCRVFVSAGAPAWDECADPCSGQEGGQLTVHVARLYPSPRFPEEDREVRGLTSCQPPNTTAAELVVTLLRCAPTIDERGCPPAADELEAAARVVHVDSVTVYNAVMCCLPTTAGPRGRRFVMGAQTIIGPMGGCVGVEQRVTVALPGCAPCPADESP
ncbi:hypothetical protein F5972_08090 [Microbispora cellulosiformans]|uniref:Uncharacterized protein n=1 Tax=Microbispora cellulosiformans TaxID=2614688 RepID=A0A5J5K527_9ACTN|nr:hypothetical protein [Microbispora cellulosiformans]KAA9379606.1 hypothetical protein F5972_08090 [Microbispora cellulosiformans]